MFIILSNVKTTVIILAMEMLTVILVSVLEDIFWRLSTGGVTILLPVTVRQRGLITTVATGIVYATHILSNLTGLMARMLGRWGEEGGSFYRRSSP